MIYVPAGTFQMGCDPAHNPLLSSLYEAPFLFGEQALHTNLDFGGALNGSGSNLKW